MIKRLIEISREPAHLAVHLDQLLVQAYGPNGDGPEGKRKVTSIPCEDIGVVMVDQPRTTYSHQALGALMNFGAVLVVCGRDHLPAGLLLPLSSNGEVVWRIQEQIAASDATRRRLWQQLVAGKVRAQARNLEAGSPARRLLEELAKEVKPGDPTNVEAQAARVYWSAWLGQARLAGSVTAGGGEVAVDGKDFRRNPDGLDAVNVMLNYGYAVLRAAVARALVSAGLFPALGIHHCNRANAFALADDLVEPLRPLIDVRVRDLHQRGRGRDGLDQLTKAHLLGVLHTTVRVGEQAGPLLVALHRVTASLVRCLQGQAKTLDLPEATDGGATNEP